MTNKMLEHVHIAETNLQTTEQSYIWKCGCRTFLNMKNKMGWFLHIEMLEEKSWRLKQGIIYDCCMYPGTEVF